MIDQLVLGEVTVQRVEETRSWVATPQDWFPGTDELVWKENKEWLMPEHWSPSTNLLNATMQTWILRSAGRVVLIDTGIGNGKRRPAIPIFDNLATNFLDNLRDAGVSAEDVDLVVNTHVHCDHVGWNTTWHDGEWIPTFPNATYLFCERDLRYWNPENPIIRIGDANNAGMFEDSVAPILRSGKSVSWDNEYVIDDNLRLELAAGHTPGSAVVNLNSGTDRAIFVGDVLHSPMQINYPDMHTCFCEDSVTGVKTRRRVLSRAADEKALVIPAHFGGSHTARVERDGDRFRISAWG